MSLNTEIISSFRTLETPGAAIVDFPCANPGFEEEDFPEILHSLPIIVDPSLANNEYLEQFAIAKGHLIANVVVLDFNANTTASTALTTTANSFTCAWIPDRFETDLNAVQSPSLNLRWVGSEVLADIASPSEFLVANTGGMTVTNVFTPSTQVSPPRNKPTPDWIESVYNGVSERRSREALLTLYREVNNLLTADQFLECGEILSSIDLSRLDTTLAVGVLSSAFPAREKIGGWEKLYQKVKFRLFQLDPKRVQNLVKGLE